MKTICFADGGQDFLEWEIEKGKVVGCFPFQGSVWVGCRILNRLALKAGDKVRIRTKTGDKITLRYPLTQVRRGESAYAKALAK